MGPGKQGFHFRQAQPALKLVDFSLEDFKGFLARIIFGKFQPLLYIGLGLLQLGPFGDFFLQLGFFLENGREGIGIVPCPRPGQAGFDFLEALLFASQVKDASIWR
jgi:hypothetical protein